MVDNDVLQEAGAVRERADAEVGGDRLTKVGERLARSDVYALAYVGSGTLTQVGSGFSRRNALL